MSKTEKLLLSVLKNEPVGRSPIWLMRQAGRYLPEYRELRSQASGFIDFCMTPTLAAEATLQPVRRFGMDAAILFADILLIPHALGQRLDFKEGEGPILDPLRDKSKLALLKGDIEKLEPVFETIERVKKELEDDTALIGFAGGLWTVACYMIEGRSGKGFPSALQMVESDKEFMLLLLDQLHDTTLEYLGRQIEAGADVIQLFESHAGLLDGESFKNFVIDPTKRLVDALHAEYPNVPIIGFPRGASEKDYTLFATESGVDALGLDQSVSIKFARETLRAVCPLQGNLDPALLLQGGAAMKQKADEICRTFGPQHIFNLGHGVIKETPPENVADLVAFVKEWRA